MFYFYICILLKENGMKKIFILLTITTLLFSCAKEPGKGGASKLKGKVVVDEYSVYNNKYIRSYYAVDESVYIIYGDNDYYSDKVKTDENGYYEFKGLQKGDYKLFTYYEDINEDKLAIYVNANIESNGSIIDAPYMKVTNFVSEGNASVKGRLFVYDYNSDLTALKDTFYGADRYVYFALKDNETYLDRVKTNPDGYYVFENLLPGDYEVYAYSKTTTSAGQIAMKKYFSLTVDEDLELPLLKIID